MSDMDRMVAGMLGSRSTMSRYNRVEMVAIWAAERTPARDDWGRTHKAEHASGGARRGSFERMSG